MLVVFVTELADQLVDINFRMGCLVERMGDSDDNASWSRSSPLRRTEASIPLLIIAQSCEAAGHVIGRCRDRGPLRFFGVSGSQ